MKAYKKNTNALVILILILLTAPMTTAGAQELNSNQAAALMKRIDGKLSSESSQSRMIMRIYPDGANGKFREYRVESRERGEEVSSMLFIAPRSIAGMKILELGDDIRVFFPSTGRIRRITANQKSGSVGGIGGDFSYEDMGSGGYCSEYSFSFLRTEDNLIILHALPKDTHSSYEQVLFYINKETERVIKCEYFVPGEGLKKTLTLQNYSLQDGIDRPGLLRMTNHRSGQLTEVEIIDSRYGIPLEEKYFDPARFYK